MAASTLNSISGEAAMSRARFCLVVISLLTVAPLTLAIAQFGGSRAGVGVGAASGSPGAASLPIWNPETAEAFLTIDATAEVRVRPTQIRVVLAVVSEAETAQLCQQQANEQIARLRAAWKQVDLDGDKIVEDFIAVLPRYEWQEEQRNGRDMLVEKRSGYRLQSNVHLAVPDEAAAQAALGLAFEQGVADIIAFDYSHDDLDAVKRQARAAALKEAQAKADLLLGAVLERMPPVINVQEDTAVHYPESLYHSFENVDDQQVVSGWRDGLPRIHAHRPKNTYYRGLIQGGDIQPRELPMNAEITVVSTVRLYYASPAAERRVVEKE
jgi:uncharacterized protein YggE